MESANWQERTLLLFDEKKIQILNSSHVLVCGLGGVGGVAAEMLCRAGIGQMTIVDTDTITPSNRNRQLIAMASTEGEKKTWLMKKRLLDINPNLKLTVVDKFITDDCMDELLDYPYSYVVDAIDTISPKIFLINHALMNQLPLVSSMGAGGRIDPLQVKVGDFSESYQCKLALNIRKRLKKYGVREGFKVVFSTEPTNENALLHLENETNKKTTVGTVSYMPAVFGCTLASVVIRDLLGEQIPLARRPGKKLKRKAIATF